MASLNAFAVRAKNTLITLPQVHAPGLVGSVVRALTGGSAKPRPVATFTGDNSAARTGTPRYAPEGNGRVNGIKAAQAAAAPLPRPATAG